ncbi:MAG TPA: hypothetical protein VJT73_06960 [Polyangiaceae bacterium]|nr:hypothetical protein [Polyangiaceae bacterium]
MKKLLLGSLGLLLAAGCSRPPRPAAMAEADGVRQAAAGQTAASLAPEAFAHAEKIRKDSEAAYQSGDLPSAQILAERALAAYQHALVLGRVASANQTANRARLALRQAEQALSQTEGEQKRVAAQADDLELRIKVIKDAAPTVPSGSADAAREVARLASARSLALDARLLCGAARLVSADLPVLTRAQAAVEELEQRLTTRPAPIDAAMRTRAQCLAALTASRRAAAAASSLGKADQLLSELSAMGAAGDSVLSPVRDDRGVVVTLRGLFAQADLTREGRQRVEALGRVAQAHPEFPVQVVVHEAGPATKGPAAKESADKVRGETIAKVLSEAGAKSERIVVEGAGSAHPALDPSVAREKARSDRVEIIFVDPGG